MTRFFRLMIATLILGIFSSCASEPATSQSAPSSEPVASPSTVDPEEEVSKILFAYYEDISNEQLDPQQYFAPTLDRFFSSQSISREEVAKSIRAGFEQLQSREIKLDPSSLDIRQEGGQYIAEFSGTSTVLREGEDRSLEQPFSNRVTFNEDLKIVGYESLASEAQSRSMAPARTMDAGPAAVYEALIQGFRSGNLASIESHIHPEKGFYLMTQPGAVAVPYKLSKAEDMYSQAPWFRDGLTKLRPTPENAPLPEFDCGDFFSKEGSFMAEVSGYDGVSDLMSTLVEYELGDYAQADIDQAQVLEKGVSHQMIDTGESLSLLLGQIDGTWYLLVVDIATYDCSA